MPKEKLDYGEISGKTAISRRAVSVPTRELISSGRITSDATVLNHGRGKAHADAEALSSIAGGYAEYDPNYAPDRSVLDNRYDIVVSNYVLNVLPPHIRKQAWKDIAQATGGTAYITVRSTGDKGIRGKRYEDGIITGSGTFQKPYTAQALVREAKKYFNNVEVIMGRKGGISWTIAASDPKLHSKVDTGLSQEIPSKKTTHNNKEIEKHKQWKRSETEPDDEFEAELQDIRMRAGITS